MNKQRDDETVASLLTMQRLNSYLLAVDGDLESALDLYEWNAEVSAAMLLTLGQVEVVIRNSMDAALTRLARRRGWDDWLDQAPLDDRGRADVGRARSRVRRVGSGEDTHGKVIAELSLGFWRYLAASRYLTSLWTPELYSAFPCGPADKRQLQQRVDHGLKQLLVVRNRVAHHEPVHRRDLGRDLEMARQLASWVHPAVGHWLHCRATIPQLMAARPFNEG